MAKFEKRYFTSIAGFKDSAAGKPEPDPIVCLVYTAPDRGTYWFRDRTSPFVCNVSGATLAEAERHVAEGNWIELNEGEAESHLYRCRKEPPPWSYKVHDSETQSSFMEYSILSNQVIALIGSKSPHRLTLNDWSKLTLLQHDQILDRLRQRIAKLLDKQRTAAAEAYSEWGSM